MNERVANLLMGLGILIIPSALIGIGASIIFGVPWYSIFVLGVGLQLGWHVYTKHYKEPSIIEQAVERYNELEYKKYLIPLSCQACNRENNIEMDLSSTEFDCEFCDQTNAIYINFSTALTTDPLYDPNDFLANASQM